MLINLTFRVKLTFTVKFNLKVQLSHYDRFIHQSKYTATELIHNSHDFYLDSFTVSAVSRSQPFACAAFWLFGAVHWSKQPKVFRLLTPLLLMCCNISHIVLCTDCTLIPLIIQLYQCTSTLIGPANNTNLSVDRTPHQAYGTVTITKITFVTKCFIPGYKQY